MAAYSVVQTAASTVDSKGWPLAASMDAQSVAMTASTLAHTTVGSLVDQLVEHWAATMGFYWADTKASQTVALTVDWSAVQTDAG